VGVALSDERMGLLFVRVIICSNMSFVISYKIFIFYMIYMFKIHMQYMQGLCQSGLRTADYALFLVASATTAV
jgi:hypothetical protein